MSVAVVWAKIIGQSLVGAASEREDLEWEGTVLVGTWREEEENIKRGEEVFLTSLKKKKKFFCFFFF